MTPKTGYTATIYTSARCEEGCRMDIYNLDQVWPSPEIVINRLEEDREELLDQFDEMECREYYGRLKDYPEECNQTFDNMIRELREIVVRWNTRREESIRENPDDVYDMPFHADEEFEDVSVRINAVGVYL